MTVRYTFYELQTYQEKKYQRRIHINMFRIQSYVPVKTSILRHVHVLTSSQMHPIFVRSRYCWFELTKFACRLRVGNFGICFK